MCGLDRPGFVSPISATTKLISGRVEIAHRDMRHAGFCCAPGLQSNDISEVEPAGENFVQVESIHAYDPLAAAECMQSVFRQLAFSSTLPLKARRVSTSTLAFLHLASSK